MLKMVKKALLCISIITIGILVYLSRTEKLPLIFSAVKNNNEASIGTLEYRNLLFDKDKNDVFSFLHIQKTGGTTMEKHLVFNIKNSNCQCKKTKKPSCMCYRKDFLEIWLICRYIDPKWPCGLHPDFVTLKECTPHFMDTAYTKQDRRYFYGTILREPVHRFISEFRHMQRGANWEAAAISCKGSQLSTTISPCFEGKIWLDLTLHKFLSCSYNLALNRQTWMLSNISAITCDFKELMEHKNYQTQLLSIAKENLNSLIYFGLLEYPTESQFVFEKTFKMQFDEPFQLWDTGFVKAYLENDTISEEDMNKIKEANALDIQLYKYAKTVFFQRYNYFKNKYGKPYFKSPPKKSRFAIKNVKKRRLKDNIPKSEKKERNLKKKIEEERKRQRLKKSKERKLDDLEEDYIDNTIEDDNEKENDNDEDKQDEESFVSKKFHEKIKSFRKSA